MLRISFQTLRARRGTLAGAFVAIWLAVTLAYATGLLMDAALSPPGPGRFAAADAVVRADPSVQTADGETEDVDPRRRDSTPTSCSASTARVGDISFAVGAWDAHGRRLSGDPLHAHGWASAPLTPYRLIAGRAPAGPHEVVARRAPRGRRPRAHRHARRRGDLPRHRPRPRPPAPTLFFADRVARPPLRRARPGQRDRHPRRRARVASRAPLEVLDREHAAAADAGDPRAPTGPRSSPSSGRWAGSPALVALFVVAGTFTLAIVQRRREVAVMRALGAAPHQVRRLIAGEALIVSLVAGVLGLLAGRPLARRDRRAARRPRRRPDRASRPAARGSRSSPRSAAAS